MAVASAVLLLITLVSREWIETVFVVDPDGGSGGLEWALVAVMVAATVVCAMLGRVEWRRSLAT